MARTTGKRMSKKFRAAPAEAVKRPMRDQPFYEEIGRASGGKIAAQIEKEAQAELLAAASGLLDFVKDRFPADFKPGGRGFTCPHHERLNAAVATVFALTAGRP